MARFQIFRRSRKHGDARRIRRWCARKHCVAGFGENPNDFRPETRLRRVEGCVSTICYPRRTTDWLVADLRLGAFDAYFFFPKIRSICPKWLMSWPAYIRAIV